LAGIGGFIGGFHYRRVYDEFDISHRMAVGWLRIDGFAWQKNSISWVAVDMYIHAGNFYTGGLAGRVVCSRLPVNKSGGWIEFILGCYYIFDHICCASYE
jgi:hypothetical protein